MRFYTHDSYLQHQVSPGHPERPERLTYLLSQLEASGQLDNMEVVQAPLVDDADVLRAHEAAHLRFVTSMRAPDEVVPLDPDTWLSPGSEIAARHAAGAVCDAVSAALDNTSRRSFCAVRPPGHHAESDAAMGFCIFNSIAIGALRALASGSAGRVAILDFDVHHGNGTVEICKEHPDVLVCSSFQHPYYPHRFYASDRDNVINTPLPAGSGSSAFRQAIEADWLPALASHQPDLILVSAGFDAHEADPLAQLNLQTDDFAWVTELITDQAQRYCQGRVVSVLEGGYDLDALADSVSAHIQVLARA